MSRYFLPIAKPGSLVLAVLAALASVSAEPAAKEAAGGLSLFGRLVGPEGRPVVKRFYGISIAVPLGKMVDRKAVPPFASVVGQTDAQGAFSAAFDMTDLPPRCLVVVPRAGWARVDVGAAAGPGAALGEVKLRPLVPVRGVVRRRATGEPVAALAIDLSAAPGEPQVPVLRVITKEGISDPRGVFHYDLPEGDYGLRLFDERWILCAPPTIHCREGHPLTEVQVQVARAPLLRCTVLSVSGRPIAAGTTAQFQVLQLAAEGQCRTTFSRAQVAPEGAVSWNSRTLGRARVWVAVAHEGCALSDELSLDDGKEVEWRARLLPCPPVSTFESGYDAITVTAARMEIDETTAASGSRSLRVTFPSPPTVWELRVIPGEMCVESGWVLEFDYKASRLLPVNVYVCKRRGGSWQEIGFMSPDAPGTPATVGVISEVVADGRWHHARFGLHAALTAHGLLPDATSTEGWLVSFASPRTRGGAPLQLGGDEERTFWLDNVRLGLPDG